MQPTFTIAAFGSGAVLLRIYALFGHDKLLKKTYRSHQIVEWDVGSMGKFRKSHVQQSDHVVEACILVSLNVKLQKWKFVI